jgi:NAD(P)-dependent dehydrogenase (short-subunit alcohol dehydrogenase family)
MKHELGQMRAQGSGAIVNCSSIAGLVGGIGRLSYTASKRGVIGLTTSAALECAPRGIRINAVCPGTIETPMVADMAAKRELDRTKATAATPIGRLGRGEEIAGSVLWLCSPGASFVVGVALQSTADSSMADPSRRPAVATSRCSASRIRCDV